MPIMNLVGRNLSLPKREENIMFMGHKIRPFLCSTVFLALSAAVAATSTQALADPKPSGSKPADASVIKQAHSGKSWKWSEGGAFFAKNGEFQAMFKGAIGLGTWSVNRSGTLCYNATWYWDDGGVKSEKIKNCWRHVVDREGNIWQRNHEKEDWYKWNGSKLSNGNKYKSKIARSKKKFGV